MQRNPLRSLARRRDFESVFREGASLSSKYLVIYARLNGLEFNRIGLAVGKKIGISVTRNRIRRLLREALRKVISDIPVHFDFVLIATRHTADGTFDDFVHILRRFVKRILNEKLPDISHQAL
ncbi:MAG: ribonuclease P protein component [Nitrospirota bacterium]